MERAGGFGLLGRRFVLMQAGRTGSLRLEQAQTCQAAAQMSPPIINLSGMEAEWPRPPAGLVHDSPPGQPEKIYVRI